MGSKKKLAWKKVPQEERHIVAIGGGSFALSKPAVDYVFKLAKKRRKRKIKVLVVATPTGDADSSLLNYYKNLSKYDCSIDHLPFFTRTPPDLEGLVFEQDLIFVGGGNTKSMLAVWRDYKFDQLLIKAWNHGIVLAGSSAGGICWFEQCLTDSFDKSYTALDCLGILKGSCAPHYDGEEGRRETFHSLIINSELSDGIAIDECVGVHFKGKKLNKIISDDSKKTAYRVKLKDGVIKASKIGKLK